MTTLPQTTSIRLPRPAAGGQLAGPVGGYPVLGGQPTGSQMTAADVFRVLRAHLWLILLTVTGFGVLGYFANGWLMKNYPTFTAIGLVQVQTRTDFNPLSQHETVMDQRALEVEQRTEARLLKQDTLFGEVLRNSQAVRDTQWFKEFHNDTREMLRDLQKQFRVEPILDTKLISVSMSYSDPKDCRTIVQEVVDTHLKNQKHRAQDAQIDRTKELNNIRVQDEIHRRQLEQDMKAAAVRLSIDGMGAAGRFAPKELELSRLIDEQIKAQSLASEAKSAYETAANMIQNGIDPPLVEEMISRDMNVAQYRSQLDNMELQIALTSKSTGAGNPQVQRYQDARDLLQKRLDSARDEVRIKGRQAVLAEYQGKFTSSQTSAESINKQVDKLKAELGELSNQLTNYLSMESELKYVREHLKEVEKKLDEISAIQRQPDLGGVQWMTQPETPQTQSFPQLKYTLPVALVLGLMLSVGVAFLREAMDTTVRSPIDIQRVGQLNLLGVVPDESDDPQSAGARLPLVIFEAPHSMMAEQFRQVRTRLQHAASLDTTRTILVTSPGPGDGKSTVAVNLATGLALNGRRILLVDANFRRPELHKIFGLGNEAGFADALNAVENFDQVVRETQVPNLSVLTSGVRPTNPTELLESQLFTDFIERALEDFDHVIFDSGPMLFVSETVALAPRVDGVVSVVRARTNSRGLLQRMRDGLRQVKAEHLGIVLNAVRAQAGGYYTRNIKTYYAYQNGQH